MGIKKMISKAGEKAANKVAKLAALSPEQLEEVQNNRDKYFLWKFLGDNKWEKIGQNNNPLVLEEKIYGKQKNGKD